MSKSDISKHTGLLFELKIGLNRNNALVIDYGGKPVAKIREALKEYKYHANLCAAVTTHVLSWNCTNFKEAPQLDDRRF